MDWPCPRCGKEWPTKMKMLAHIGGAHGQDTVFRRAKCGTRSGYVAHVQRKETACGPCKGANAAYQAKWRARKGAWGTRQKS